MFGDKERGERGPTLAARRASTPSRRTQPLASASLSLRTPRLSGTNVSGALGAKKLRPALSTAGAALSAKLSAGPGSSTGPDAARKVGSGSPAGSRAVKCMEGDDAQYAASSCPYLRVPVR